MKLTQSFDFLLNLIFMIRANAQIFSHARTAVPDYKSIKISSHLPYGIVSLSLLEAWSYNVSAAALSF
jgi:hypothetical protein